MEASAKIQERIPPILTKEDAERPLSAEEKELLDEYEEGMKIAKQGSMEVVFIVKVQLARAGLLLRLGRYAEAESVFKEILVNEPNNTLAMTGLGITFLKTAKYSEAEEILKKALVVERARDPDSNIIVLELSNLVEFYQARGKYAEAEPYLQQVLETSEKMLGKDHPYIAMHLNNLCLLYEAQGKYAEAEALYKRAVEIAEKSWGPDNPNTVRIRKNMDICHSKAQGSE